MSTGNKKRIGNDARFKVTLKDNGVAVAWDSLLIKGCCMWSAEQKAYAGACEFSIDPNNNKALNVVYRASEQNYLGDHRLVVRVMLSGNENTYDAYALTLCQMIADQASVQITDTADNIDITVSEVNTTIMAEILAACQKATDDADAATTSAVAAAASATSAASSANSAASSATSAATSATSAASSANSAASSATSAATSANNAATLATAAKDAATAAAASATSASSSANTQASNAQSAAASATSAASSANSAASSATSAATAATNAASSANSAAQAANTATATITASLVDYRKSADQDAIDATKASASEVAQLSSKLGNLSNLTTTEKSNLVGAINELRSNIISSINASY